MKTINIKGKEYVPVVERIKEFHKLYPMGEIKTEIVTNAPFNSGVERISVKATILLIGDKEGNKEVRTFTGHSQAIYREGMMGDVALEIAETSAIGRALGFAGIGLLDGIASADEMRKVKMRKVKKVKVGEAEEDDDLGF